MVQWYHTFRDEASYFISPLMKEFQEKQKAKRMLYSKPALVLMGIVLMSLLYATWNMYQKSIAPQSNFKHASERLEDLKVRELNLLARIEVLSTEEGIEQELRQKFGYVREGEEVVMIVDNREDTPLYSDISTEDESFFQKLMHVFGF